MVNELKERYRNLLIIYFGGNRASEVRKFMLIIIPQIIFLLVSFVSYLFTRGPHQQGNFVIFVAMLAVTVLHALAFILYACNVRPLIVRLVPYLTHQVSHVLFTYYWSWFFGGDVMTTFVALFSFDMLYQVLNLAYQLSVTKRSAMETLSRQKLVNMIYYPGLFLLYFGAFLIFVTHLFRLDFRIFLFSCFLIAVFTRQAFLHLYAQSIDMDRLLRTDNEC